MRSSSARERPRLVSGPALAGLCLAFAALLVALFPAPVDLDHLEGLRRLDPVALTHLRLLLDSRPEDDAVRLGLAEQLVRVGDLEGARRTLAPIRAAGGSAGVRARLLELEIDRREAAEARARAEGGDAR